MTLPLERINGYVVVAERPASHDVRSTERIILAVRPFTNYPGSRLEYVVARTAARENHPTEWVHGDYTTNFDHAIERYNER